jgi:hypothetical protein
MIFKDSKELAATTGNYFANNNFDKVRPYLETASLNMAKIIGAETIKKAEDIYLATEQSETDAELLKIIQHPIAIMGTLQLYRHNDIAHEDTGRKVKIDADKEKLPWEWQLNRDDDIMLNDYYDAVDNLLIYLEDKKIDTWLVQKTRIGFKSLLLPDSNAFSRFWDIDSPRIFIQLLPLIKEAQRRWLVPAYGKEDFEELLLTVQNNKAYTVPAYEYAANALVLYTMHLAFKRGIFSIIPQGIIQKNLQSDGTFKGESISYSTLNKYTEYLRHEADILLDDMKIIKQGPQTYELLPNNDKNNKYMIL